MASRFSDLLLRINADPSRAKVALAELNRGLVDVNRQAQATTGGFRTLAGSLQSIGLAGFASITAPIVGVGVAALQMSARIESAGTAFTTMTGSAQKAAVLLNQIKQFAATTPFEFPELVRSSQKLLGFGVSAEKVIPTLRSIGNAVSAVGGGSVEVDRITLALGQMAAKGKVSQQEMNQLAETGLPVRDILAKGLGVTTSALVDLQEKGLIPADKAIRILLAGFDTRFGGALEAQSKTLQGIFSNLKDQVSLTLAEMGDVLAPTAKRIATEFVAPALTKLQELAKGFGELSPAAQNGVLGLSAFLATAPLIIGATGLMIDGVIKLRAAMALAGAPFSIASAAIAGFITASSSAVASMAGIQAGAASLNATLGITAAALTAAGFALYEIGRAYLAASDAQDQFTAANKLAGDGIAKVRAIALQRGAGNLQEFRELEQNYKSGIISATEYSERLGNLVRKLTDLQGAIAPVAVTSEKFSTALQTTTKAAKELEAVKLPEWAKFADLAFERLLATTPNLTDALKDALREENFNRATAAVKETTQSIFDLITAGLPLRKVLSTDIIVQGLREQQKFAAELLKIDEARLAARRDLDQIEITRSPSGNPGSTAVLQGAGEVLRTQQRQRQEATTAKGVYEQLAATQGKNSQAALQALRNWQEAEQKATGVTRTSVLEVSTVITNLSQGLARNIIEWKGFGSTVIGILKEVGQSILSNLFQSLLKSSGVIDKLSGGLSKVLGKVPGLGKIFGGVGGAAGGAATQAASAATQAATSAATTATTATAAAVTSSLTSVLGAVGSLGSLATGIIGNVLAFKTGKDTARIEVTSRETFAEIFNLRRDEWTRFESYSKWQGQLVETMNRFGDAHGRYLSEILATLQGGGLPVRTGAATGSGVTVQIGNVYGGPLGLDELAAEIARRLGRQA